MNDLKEFHRLQQTLGFVRNRIPGRKRIEELRRISLELQIEADMAASYLVAGTKRIKVEDINPEGLRADARLLAEIADQLDDIRWNLRGPNRDDRARTTRKWSDEEMRPFTSRNLKSTLPGKEGTA